MMTLKDVKDWMKQQISADHWSIGSYDNSKDKTICIRNLSSNRGKLAISGIENTSISVKGISIVVHWNKNPDETERTAQSVFELFYGKAPVISGYRTVMFDMRNDEPISVGTDGSGIYEYVIETWIMYMKKKED